MNRFGHILKGRSYVFLSVLVLLKLFVGLHAHPVWQGFYRACAAVETDMTKAQVLNLMGPFVDQEEATVNAAGEGTLPYSPVVQYDGSLAFSRAGLLDDDQCNAYFKSGKVIFVQKIFD